MCQSANTPLLPIVASICCLILSKNCNFLIRLIEIYPPPSIFTTLIHFIYIFLYILTI